LGTNKLFIAVASVASCAVVAQPEVAATDAELKLVEQIAELQAEGGPTAEALIEPLRGLALLHQEAGDHALAILALEQARHATRLHRGLASVDEALLLRQEVHSEKALGHPQRVWDLEQEMVTIARQHPDDMRVVPIFRELGEDRSDVLKRFRAGEFPPQIYIGCYYGAQQRRYDDTRAEQRPTGEDASCLGGSRSTVIEQLRGEILMYYADAIEVIVINGDYASQELRDLEQQAFLLAPAGPPFGPELPLCRGTLDQLVALELLGTCLEPVIQIQQRAPGSRTHKSVAVIANVGGLPSLVRALAYEIRSGAPAAARAAALLDIADWHHPRSRFDESPLTYYEQVFEELRQSDDSRALAVEIFSPEIPVTLPTYRPNPFTPVAAHASSRYIEVGFDITQYGRSSGIEILETSSDATRAERRDLLRSIEATSFRPRVVDGELADSARVTVRYHLPVRTGSRTENPGPR
jgi:hypothetical protein